MDDIYDWLFDAYALPQMQELDQMHDKLLDQLAGALALSCGGRLSLCDVVSGMRLQWGAEAFRLGVRMGLALNGPRPGEPDCGWLMSFLPQLDNPVS